MDKYHQNRSFLAKCLGHGTGDTSKITKQDALYWMDRKGPKVYMIIFQIQLVFTSAYVSLLLLSFVEHVFEYCELGVTIAYTLVSFLPIYLLVSKYQESVANVAMACSFGIHRRPQAVSQVIRDEKVGRIVRAIMVVCKLERATENGFSMDNSGGHHSHGTSTTSHTGATGGHISSSSSSIELEEVGKSFDALDPSGDGRIECGELASVFEAMGVHTSQENIQAMLQVLDKNGDGHVAKDEFISFYSTHVLSSVGVDDHSLHELAHNWYHRFDRDHNGQITLGEFKDVMDAFNVGFTMNEIGHLVNELDEHDDGQVGEHEFLELLKKHRHLFERHELPKLQ
jgi:Ca2+-binding EF-hand superfamily protein